MLKINHLNLTSNTYCNKKIIALKEKKENLINESHCKICLESEPNQTNNIFKKRILYCGHTFCKLCLDKLPKKECPVCATLFFHNEIQKIFKLQIIKNPLNFKQILFGKNCFKKLKLDNLKNTILKNYKLYGNLNNIW